MSKEQFTPGPWILGGCSGRMVRPDAFYGGDGFISDVDTIANARLVAAAPNLYAACREVADCSPRDRLRFRAAIAMAHAALAKADGALSEPPRTPYASTSQTRREIRPFAEPSADQEAVYGNAQAMAIALDERHRKQFSEWFGKWCEIASPSEPSEQDRPNPHEERLCHSHDADFGA